MFTTWFVCHLQMPPKKRKTSAKKKKNPKKQKTIALLPTPSPDIFLKQELAKLFPNVIGDMIKEFLNTSLIWILAHNLAIYSFDPFCLDPAPWNWQEPPHASLDPMSKPMGEIIMYKNQLDVKQTCIKSYFVSLQTQNQKPVLLLVQHLYDKEFFHYQDDVQAFILDPIRMQQTRCVESQDIWHPPQKKPDGSKLEYMVAHPTKKHQLILVYYGGCICLETWDVDTRIQSPLSLDSHIMDFHPETTITDSTRLYFIQHRAKNLTLAIYNVLTNEWTHHQIEMSKQKDYDVNRLHASPMIWQNQLLLICGRYPFMYGETSAVKFIDLKTFFVSEGYIGGGRMGHSAAILNNGLFILGGNHRDSGIKDTLFYTQGTSEILSFSNLTQMASPKEWERIDSSVVFPLLDIL